MTPSSDLPPVDGIIINKRILKDSVRCPTLGWRMARQEPESPDVELLAVFKQGNVVEDVAIEQIGGGNRMPVPRADAVQKTREAIDSDSLKNIIQPAFEVSDVIIRPDVIDGKCSEMTEIKSAKRVKDDYSLDMAISLAAAEHAGHVIDKTTIMHVNPEYRVGGTEPVMVSQDVTEQVRAIADEYDIEDEIDTLRSPTMPGTELKRACKDCPFVGECFEDPGALVVNIPRLSEAKLQTMLDADVHTMDELKADEDLYESLTAKQKESVENHLNPADEDAVDITVDTERLAEDGGWLLTPILLHADFETSTLAIPQRTGEEPWGQSVTQFSVTTDDGESLTEIGYLSDGTDDREELAQAMIAALEGDAPVVVYSQAFEKARIQELADALPHLSKELMAISARIVDLLPLVRSCMTGLPRESLKVVAPVVDSTFTYDDLQIKNGKVANAVMTLLRLEGGADIIRSKTGMDVEEARAALLNYCARDTLATAVVSRHLRDILEDLT